MKKDILRKLTDFKGISELPQSHLGDLEACVDLLSYCNPTSVLELGAGSGEWILFLSAALPKFNINYIGVDHFQETDTQSILEFDASWPANEIEWLDRIKIRREELNKELKVNITNNIDIIPASAADIGKVLERKFEVVHKMFDVVRIDCFTNKEETYSALSKILPYTTDDCIILVDDIGRDTLCKRHLALERFERQGILEEYWRGMTEGAWIKKGNKNSKITRDQFVKDNHEKVSYNIKDNSSTVGIDLDFVIITDPIRTTCKEIWD